MKNNFQANGPTKQAGLDIVILNKIDYQPKVIKKNIRKNTTHSPRKNPLSVLYSYVLSVMNIYVPNVMEPAFMKETLLKLKACIAPHNISGRFQHSSLRNELIMETETK